MKQNSLKMAVNRLWICILAFILTILSLFIFSFRVSSHYDEFLSQLGIGKTDADKKITNSILGGYFNTYGLQNAKNVALGNRAAVVKDVLDYTRKFTAGDEFKKDYIALKQSNKPVKYILQTPDEMRREMIEQYKKSIARLEQSAQKADPKTKTMLEDILAESKKQLKDAEDPENKLIRNYANNYDQMAASYERSYEEQLAEWETKYPSNEMLFVKQRLEKFLAETKNIDFNAVLVSKNGRKIFENPQYEHKGQYWKMGFRAGREVVEPSRLFIEEWIKAIK
jgi:hypothetical protein